MVRSSRARCGTTRRSAGIIGSIGSIGSTANGAVNEVGR
jgi:hypothetical protein